MFCHMCGAQLPEGARLCNNCGTMQAVIAEPQPAEPFVPPTIIEVRTGAWLSEGWNIVKQDLGMWVLAALLLIVLGAVVPFVIQGPLMVGVNIMALRKLRGERVELGMMFEGFQYFLPAFVAALLIGIFMGIGAILCIIPGFIVAAIYQFAYLFIGDRKMDFWPAMEASHAIVKQNYFGFTMFTLAYTLINIAGVLLCFVGLFFTLPMTWAAIAAAYRDLTTPAPAPR